MTINRLKNYVEKHWFKYLSVEFQGTLNIVLTNSISTQTLNSTKSPEGRF